MIVATDQWGGIRAFENKRELAKCRRLHPEIKLSNIQDDKKLSVKAVKKPQPKEKE